MILESIIKSAQITDNTMITGVRNKIREKASAAADTSAV